MGQLHNLTEWHMPIPPMPPVQPLPNVDCNDTCCSYGEGLVLCYSDYNFTERFNLTFIAPWELGVRWTFTIFIATMGFFGNLLVIIILCKNRLLLRTSVNRFILNMAFADFILVCFGPVPYTIVDTHQFYVLGGVWCHLEGYIQILVMVVSASSLAVISCDRMLGIIRPFHRHLKAWQSDVIIAVIWILSALFAMPFMLYRVYNVRIWKDMTERTCGENSKMELWWIFTIVVLIWIPVLVMVISYSTILVFLKCYNWRPKTQVVEHPAIIYLKRRVMRMVFVVILGFIICWGPFQGSRIYYWINTEDGMYTHPSIAKPYESFATVSQYLLYVNPAFNPIVYGLMHTTFKRAFKITFSCFYHKKSPFVLSRGEGPQRYIWLMRATNSAAYGDSLATKISKPSRVPNWISKKPVTPSAVVSMSSAAAAILLDPYRHSSSCSDKDDEHISQDLEALSNGDDYIGGKEGITKIRTGVSLTIVNESFVKDLPARRIRSVASTGALGHLITQVIEEETSSDFDSERIL